MEWIVGLIVVGVVGYIIYNKVISKKAANGTGGGVREPDQNEVLK